MKKSHRPKIRTDRLRELAKHVLHGKRIHDRFDIKFFHAVNCESAGCLLGEAPAVWPKFFSFPKMSLGNCLINGGLVSIYQIHLKVKGKKFKDFDAASKWFGLTEYESHVIFNRNKLYSEDSKLLLKPMSYNVTAKTAANRLLKFCDLVESGKYTEADRR